MQRRQGASKKPYVKSGIPGHSAPGGRKASPLRPMLKFVIIAAAALMAVIVAISLLSSLFQNSNTPVRINARPTDNIQAFGENVLYYDGMTLTCVDPNGKTKWQFTLGSNGDFYCTSSTVVAWCDKQIYVLDKNGTCTFNDRMSDTVRFARIGDTYVAAVIGTETASTVRIMNHTGTVFETVTDDLTDLYVVDVGFFSTGGRFVWIMSLDIQGNAPMTNVQTYEPGKLKTGEVDVDDQMVYKIYEYNSLLMFADTSKLRAYNYKMVELTDPEPILIYGWQVKQVRASGKNTYVLLESLPRSGTVTTFSEIRLVTNTTMKAYRLLSPCFASGLSEKGVYGFGSNVIYYAPYGSATVNANYLTYSINDFICMLDGGRAVLVWNDNVFILKLPT